jgi:predicted nucleotidyltransferase
MLDDESADYIKKLTSRVSGIRRVWLIGSRANGRARGNSDWDFIVFSDPASFELIRNDTALHAENIDLLVVASDGTFCRPWGSSKSGSLESWGWECVTPARARYVGTKWVPDQEAADEGMDTLGDIQREVLNAYLVWRDDESY